MAENNNAIPSDIEWYAYFFKSEDEDGAVNEGIELLEGGEMESMSLSEYREYVASFLSQTDDAYVDKWGVVHEIHEGVDQPFAYYFTVEYGYWEEVLGNMGAFLDDSENKDMPEEVRLGFEKVYRYAYDKVFKNPESAQEHN